jgi:spermidine/putrescine-binding protein
MDLKEWLNLIISICTLVTIVIMVYRTFRDPTEKNSENLLIFQEKCKGKHALVDSHIEQIHTNLSLLKENHINHIEKDIKLLQEGQIKILTILDERLPNHK